MEGKWIAPFFIIWLIGTIWGATYDGYQGSTWLNTDNSTSGNITATVSALSQGNLVVQSSSAVGRIPILTPVVEWITSAFKIVTWQWSFTAPYPMVRWFLMAFGAVGFFALTTLAYRVITGNL